MCIKWILASPRWHFYPPTPCIFENLWLIHNASKIIEPLAFWFIILHQCTKIVVNFLKRTGYVIELIHAIIGAITLIGVLLGHIHKKYLLPLQLSFPYHFKVKKCSFWLSCRIEEDEWMEWVVRVDGWKVLKNLIFPGKA